jgi:hypothetical protein
MNASKRMKRQSRRSKKGKKNRKKENKYRIESKYVDGSMCD